MAKIKPTLDTFCVKWTTPKGRKDSAESSYFQTKAWTAAYAVLVTTHPNALFSARNTTYLNSWYPSKALADKAAAKLRAQKKREDDRAKKSKLRGIIIDGSDIRSVRVVKGKPCESVVARSARLAAEAKAEMKAGIEKILKSRERKARTAKKRRSAKKRKGQKTLPLPFL